MVRAVRGKLGAASQPLTVQLSGHARRVLRGDITGDGLEDARSIMTVGSIDFALLRSVR